MSIQVYRQSVKSCFDERFTKCAVKKILKHINETGPYFLMGSEDLLSCHPDDCISNVMGQVIQGSGYLYYGQIHYVVEFFLDMPRCEDHREAITNNLTKTIFSIVGYAKEERGYRHKNQKSKYMRTRIESILNLTVMMEG